MVRSTLVVVLVFTVITPERRGKMSILKFSYYVCLVLGLLGFLFWVFSIIHCSIQVEHCSSIGIVYFLANIFGTAIPELFFISILDILDDGCIDGEFIYISFVPLLRRIAPDWDPGIFGKGQVQRELRFAPLGKQKNA